MCEPILAGGLVGKRIEQVRDKKKERQAEAKQDAFVNSLSQPKEKTKANSPTKINTGVNIGGQY